MEFTPKDMKALWICLDGRAWRDAAGHAHRRGRSGLTDLDAEGGRAKRAAESAGF
jgi:hypothetical protein